MSHSLEGRVVVITGATGGLGRAAAQEFAARGVSLALLGSDATRLEEGARALNLPDARALLHVVDLREGEQAREAARAVQDKFGAAHILLHLVGGWTGGKTLAELDPADFRTMLEQHAWTTLNVFQAFVPFVAASGWGRVIVVSSPGAVSPTGKTGAYAAAKAAQEAMVLTLAKEFQGQNLTANILHVRSIGARAGSTQPAGASPANGAVTTPEEIVAAMLYLCSDEAAQITGARLPLTGAGA